MNPLTKLLTFVCVIAGLCDAAWSGQEIGLEHESPTQTVNTPAAIP